MRKLSQAAIMIYAFAVAFIFTILTVDYVAPAIPNETPRLYISMTLTNPLAPTDQLALAVIVSWILGAAYGVYAFERARGAGSVRQVISEKINNVR